MKTKTTVITLFLLASLVASAQVETEMKALVETYETAFNQKNVSAILDMHSDDVQRYNQDGTLLNGKAAVRAYLDQFFGMVDAKANIGAPAQVTEIAKNTVSIVGTYSVQMSPKGSEVEMTYPGQYATICQKVKGMWLIKQHVLSVPSANTADVKKHIDGANAILESWLDNAAVKNLGQVYAENVVTISPNSEPKSGLVALQEEIKHMAQWGKSDYEFSAIDVRSSGTLAVEQGSYTWSFEAKDGSPIPSMTDEGHYLTVWEKIGDDWKITLEAAPISSRAVTVSDAILKDFAGAFGYNEGQILSLAEAIPESKYKWSPAKGVRSVSEVLLHTASANYFFGMKLGTQLPVGVDMANIEKITGKDNIIRTVRESFAFALESSQQVDPATLGEKVDLPFGDFTRQGLVLLMLDHSGEHKGQLIAYARVNGIKPPWSK